MMRSHRRAVRRAAAALQLQLDSLPSEEHRCHPASK
jgi:hypothetical protein